MITKVAISTNIFCESVQCSEYDAEPHTYIEKESLYAAVYMYSLILLDGFSVTAGLLAKDQIQRFSFSRVPYGIKYVQKILYEKSSFPVKEIDYEIPRLISFSDPRSCYDVLNPYIARNILYWEKYTLFNGNFCIFM